MAKQQGKYPLPGFWFEVRIGKTKYGFRDVSGIGAEVEIAQEYHEGGNNAFVYKLPGAVSHPNLVLSKGIMRKGSSLDKWLAKINDTVKKGYYPVEKQNIVVFLNDELGKHKLAWKFAAAYPVRWEVSALSAQDESIAIDTVEFAYQGMSTERP